MTDEAGKELIETGGNHPMVVGGSVFLDVGLFEHAQRVAKMLITSDMIGKHFKDNIGNILIALNLAHRWRADPFMVMQNIYIVHGKPGLEGKLVIALMNQSNKFSTLQYDFTRDSNGKTTACRAFATEKATGNVLEQTVTWAMVQAEGWDKPKKGTPSKWVTMPDLMFQYRSATFFARVYCPEVLLGMQTTEEIFDFTDMGQGSDGAFVPLESTASDLAAEIKKRAEKQEKEGIKCVVCGDMFHKEYISYGLDEKPRCIDCVEKIGGRVEEKDKKPSPMPCPYCQVNIKTVIVTMLESGAKTFTCPACKKEGKIEDGLPVGIYPADQTESDEKTTLKCDYPDCTFTTMSERGMKSHKTRAGHDKAPEPEVDPEDALLDEIAWFPESMRNQATVALNFEGLGRPLNGRELKEMLEKCQELKGLSEMSPEGQELSAVNAEINNYPGPTVDTAQKNLELPNNRPLSLDESNLLLAECVRLTKPGEDLA